MAGSPSGEWDSNVNALFPVTMAPDCLGFDLLQAPLTLNRVALDASAPAAERET